jgi:hypothetical protein
VTSVVRFTVAVKTDWTVSVSLAGSNRPVLPAPLPLWGDKGPPSAPKSMERRDTFLCQLWDESMSGPPIPDVYDKVFTKENYTAKDVQDLGSFLFNRLLGEATWRAIRAAAESAAVIELALLFEGERHDLHRFPWELMHGPSGFLLAQASPMASITRLVKRETKPGSQPLGAPGPFCLPPKLLFAVGAGLTDKRIRPGAEIFGLLRQFNARGLTVNMRVLLSASTTTLREAIDVFKPDIVHFTCHGDIEEDSKGVPWGFLEFQSEDRQGVIHRTAPELLGDLKADGHLPTVVVLSACYSAVVPSDPGSEQPPRAAGVDRIGSLAAELVAGGVPVVVGMGGRIADSACRLFTRFFGEALVRGEPLVAAVARGRRAAFIDGTPKTADWAFPVLFLAPEVAPVYSPAQRPPGKSDPCQVLAIRALAYGVPLYPVFCARHDIFERFQQLFLFRPGTRPILPIFTKNAAPGLGRHRLLQELAAQSLREGHVPCLVSSKDKNWPNPPLAGAPELAILILRAIADARQAFGLRMPFNSSVIAAILAARPNPTLSVKLAGLRQKSEFSSVLDQVLKGAGDGPSAKTCRDALQEDFKALIAEARKASEADPSLPLTGRDSRALLLLNYVHKYDKAIDPLLHELIGGFGLGPPDEPVPVIFCYALDTPVDALFTGASETIGTRAIELKPFDEADDEDLLAYEQVLLFPDESEQWACFYTNFLRTRYPDLHIEGKAASFAINHQADQKVKDMWTDAFRLQIKGIPQKMTEEEMYYNAMQAYRANFLVLGDDEAKLRKL